jgi:hypothetical protein
VRSDRDGKEQLLRSNFYLFPSIVAIAAIAYCFIIARHIDYAVGGADSSGYMNEARMLASGRLSIPIEPLRQLKIDNSYAFIFQPLGFVARGDGTIVPTYPVGTPLHFAFAAAIGGWTYAPYLVNPLFGLLAIVAMYFLGRELGLSPWMSAAGAAILGAGPVFISSIVQPCSDGLAVFWSVATMLLAYRANQRPSLAIAAGVAFAIGVAVRPTSILMAAPLAFAMSWRPRLLLRAAAGAIPIGLALMWLNASLYGSPFRTGYGTFTDVISMKALQRCPAFHVTWLAMTYTPLILIGFATLARRVTLGVWFAVFYAFYSIYDICQDWGDIRFIFPALPALIIGALLMLQRWRPVVAFVCVAAILASLVRYTKKLDPLGIAEREQIWPAAIAWAEPQLPKRAVVISGIYSGTFLYYANRWTARWDGLDTDRYETMRAYAAAAQMPWYAVTSADADIKPEAFVVRYPGKWRALSTHRDLTLWRLEE